MYPVMLRKICTAAFSMLDSECDSSDSLIRSFFQLEIFSMVVWVFPTPLRLRLKFFIMYSSKRRPSSCSSNCWVVTSAKGPAFFWDSVEMDEVAESVLMVVEDATVEVLVAMVVDIEGATFFGTWSSFATSFSSPELSLLLSSPLAISARNTSPPPPPPPPLPWLLLAAVMATPLFGDKEEE